MKRLGILAAVLLGAGCPKPSEGPVDAAVEPDAGTAVDAGVVDAGPPVPTDLAFALDFLGVDGGVTTVLSSAVDAQIDPSRSVFIQFPVPLKDYRIRMFDDAEQVLPSDEEARAEDGGMSYRIVLVEPLKPGRSYTFSMDAELGHEITDMSGHGYADIRLGLRITGTPEAPPKKKPGKKHR